MTRTCFFGIGWTNLCGPAGLLFLDKPIGADEAAGVDIGRGDGGAVGACCGGGDLATGGVEVHRGGDTTGSGDAALSCMKSSSLSRATTLWSCCEWIHKLRLGEVLM